MRSAVAFAALLLTAMSATALAQSPGPRPSVTLISPRDRIRIELDILVDGQPTTVAWDRFLDRFFDFFDRDADGALSRSECSRLPSLPLPNRTQLDFLLFALDRDKNGRVSPFELKIHCVDHSYLSVITSDKPPTADDLRLSEVFRQWFDENGDGAISANELLRTARTMSRYDLDEDGVLAQSELLSNGADRPLPTTSASGGATGLNERSIQLQVNLDASVGSVQVTKDRHALLTAVDGERASNARFRGPEFAWILAID